MLDSLVLKEGVKNNFVTYRVGDTAPYCNLEIQRFELKHTDYILFAGRRPDSKKKTALWFSYTDEGPKSGSYEKVKNTFSELRDLSDIYLSGRLKDNAERLLITAVDSSCKSNREDSIDKYFKRARDYIEQQSQHRNKLQFYLFLMIIALLVIVGIGWLLLSFDIQSVVSGMYSKIVGSCICGVLGAVLSVMLSNSKKDTWPLRPPMELILNSVLKLIVGLMSGFLIFLFVLGNVILGFANENTYCIWALAICAGFSERMVPDIIRSQIRNISS